MINDVIMVIELHLIMFGSDPFTRQLSGTTGDVALNLQLRGAYNYMRWYFELYIMMMKVRGNEIFLSGSNE